MPAPLELTTAPEPSLADRVARFLTFDEKLVIGHDGEPRVRDLPMLHVSVVVGYADHEPCSAHGPFLVTDKHRHDVRHYRLPTAAPINSTSAVVALGVAKARRMWTKP